MIFITTFDPATKQPTSLSLDSGFNTLNDVALVMGDEYVHRAPRNIIYAGIAFSDFPFATEDKRK